MKKSPFILLLLFVVFFLPVLRVEAVETVAPIRILIVPGHDNEIWGAWYGNLKEASMNLALATQIYNLLKSDKRFEVFITRDSKGYTKEFSDYFVNRKESILAFKESAKKQMQSEVANGSFVEKENILHNSVVASTSIVLYGINKWSNENKMDAVIHVHFNDIPRPNRWATGKYKGFAVYFPDPQLANGVESGRLATNIFTQLKKKYITSTYKKEMGGLLSDQKLIAMGSNGTLLPSVRSILIEYGYIYRFGNSIVRHKAYANMADLTLAGIKDYFSLK